MNLRLIVCAFIGHDFNATETVTDRPTGLLWKRTQHCDRCGLSEIQENVRNVCDARRAMGLPLYDDFATSQENT